MNTVLTIIAIPVALVILLLVIALFVKRDYSISREVVINRPQQEVFSYIRFMGNQSHYNKWWMADPGARKSEKGVDGTEGFTVYWNSENKQVGEGEQEITRITESRRIDSQVRFIRPFKGVADVSMAVEPISAEQTKLTWVFAGKSQYPMNLTNLFIDKMLGNDLAASAHNLKTVLEK